jgi:transcriptional regulator with XRE-family HTH domain
VEETNLRVIRQKYHIHLAELAQNAGICNQHMSRIELVKVPVTRHHERLVTEALYQVIAERRSELAKLEEDFQRCLGRMLQDAGGSEDEL